MAQLPNSDLFFPDHSDCIYYDTQSYNDECIDDYELRVIHENIRSVHSNFDQFDVFLNSLVSTFDIIVLSETWLVSDDWFQVSGYNSYHVIRPNRRGGGVSILVDANLTCARVPEISKCGDLFECISVVVSKRNWDYTVIGVYRPPNASLSDFNLSFSH